MKKFVKVSILLFAIYLLVLGVSAETPAPTIKVSNATAAPGETVSVAISLENNPGIASAKLLVTFDADVLTLESVADAGVLGTQVHKPELVSPYLLNWANDTVTENYTCNGAIVTLVFLVDENALEGEYPISVSYDYDNYEIIDWQMNKVEFDVENGSIKVGESLPNEISDFTYDVSGTEITITGYVGDAVKVIIADT